MAKFTIENKLQANTHYLNRNESANQIANSIGTDNKVIQKWVKQYEHNFVQVMKK